jgi:NAD-dependent dihydropyrimidine dehydrogenase PreA subunit
VKGFRYLSKVATLAMKPEKCIGCGKCVEVCPHQVFAMEERKARLVQFDACMECGACAKNCPTSAIQVESGVGCAAGLIMEWMRDRKLSRLSADCCP